MKKAAQVLKDNLRKIIELWDRSVREKILASKTTNEIALHNQVPNVLQAIAELMERNSTFEDACKDEKYREFLVNSADHGRHRATSPNYTVDQIIEEYIIFHRIVTRELSNHGVYEHDVVELLKYAIEMAMLKSAGAFAISIQEMQEKLVATLAHDMRNPLTTSQLAIQLMEEEDDEEELKRLRDMAMRGIKKTLTLTESLLDAITVKAGEGMLLTFREDDVVHHIKWTQKEAAEIYNHELILKCEKEKIEGIFDGTAIRRLLENLITNAIKYGRQDKPITITVTDTEDMVKLTVHNFGDSIPEDKQEDIFGFMGRDPNAHHAKPHSWGIGLTLVKIVAEAHGGKVQLQSSDEEGTTFIVTFYKYANPPGKARTRLNLMRS